jgi:copper chaperone NosL
MNSRLFPITRILSLACAAGLVAALFLPLWRIELSAPQYPEGLALMIYPNKLGGDVEIVNGLNHYIGMRTLHADDFIEFTVLPWIFGAFAFFGILSVVINRKWFFSLWAVLYLVFCVIAMADFYRWEYNYGHNLDPAAAIRVTGMAYQPPLIGYKQLLNFGAYSIPDSGGWIFTAVALSLLVLLFLEWRRKVRMTRKLEIMTACLALTFLSSCSNGPQPISYGKENCDFCKMTISDRRFGGEIVTRKGKVYKFDDMHCLGSYLGSGLIPEKDISSVYLIDFSVPGELVPATESFLLKSEELRSPMNGNIAAFRSADSMKKFAGQFPGEETDWASFRKP